MLVDSPYLENTSSCTHLTFRQRCYLPTAARLLSKQSFEEMKDSTRDKEKGVGENPNLCKNLVISQILINLSSILPYPRDSFAEMLVTQH